MLAAVAHMFAGPSVFVRVHFAAFEMYSTVLQQKLEQYFSYD